MTVFVSLSFFVVFITSLLDNNCSAFSTSPAKATGEVVGGRGRIGSYLLGFDKDFVSVGRNGRPGSLSDEGRPIFVSIPATEIPDVIERTLQSRRKDLVFVTNGIPSDFLSGIEKNEITAAVPYFGVLTVGGKPISDDSSPKTVINNGRHAETLNTLLKSSGIRCKIVDNLEEIDSAAIIKLIWASIMWLLCHDCEGPPITCSQVHKQKNTEIDMLLDEIMPAAKIILNTYHPGYTGVEKEFGSVTDVKRHLQEYSFSIPDAIPSKSSAIDEFEPRNGVFLSAEESMPQLFHRSLIQRVVGYIPSKTMCTHRL